MKQQLIKVSGKVVESLPNSQFLVEINNKRNRCYLSGKMARNKIRVLPGDEVVIELTPAIILSNQVGRIIARK